MTCVVLPLGAHAFLLTSVKQNKPRQNKRNAQQLSQIESHTLLKGNLFLLYELDEKSGHERRYKGSTKNAAGDFNDLGFPVSDVQNGEDEQIRKRLVEHCRVSGNIVDPEKYDGPGEVRWHAQNFRVEKVPNSNQAGRRQ